MANKNNKGFDKSASNMEQMDKSSKTNKGAADNSMQQNANKKK